MSKTIKLRKGFDILLEGETLRVQGTTESSRHYSISPVDFKGIIPKLNVEQGSEVKAGDPLFHSKTNEKLLFTSPVSGEVVEIRRGAKRVIEEIVVLSDSQNSFKSFGPMSPNDASREALIDRMLESGVWPLVRQRPFNKIADPNETPKSIFISCFDSAPLGVDYNFVVAQNEEAFKTGLEVIKRLSGGKVFLNLSARTKNADVFEQASGVEKNYFDGPHPAGNVGVQIHHLDPVISKKDLVWFVNPQDLIIIGRVFKEGIYNSERLVALAGSSVIKREYHKMKIGAALSPILSNNLVAGKQRIISGNVLSGTQVTENDYLKYYDNLVTVIPEGDQPEFMGWLFPSYARPSISKTFTSYLKPSKKYNVNTGMHGEERAYVVTGEYEKVLPMDILPMQLIKACLANDIENMEALGIYEVAAEDLALCEFICTSKTPIQRIIGDALDYIEKEA